MRALLQTIASVLCWWLNSVRGKSAAERLEGQTGDGHTEQKLRDAGEEADGDEADEAQVTAMLNGCQPPPAGDVAPSAMDEAAGNREEPLVEAAPGSSASIESNFVTARWHEEDRQPAKQHSENQKLADVPVSSVQLAKREDDGTSDPEAEPVPLTTKSKNTQEGGNGDDGTTGSDQHVGGRSVSATLGGLGSAERSDVTAVGTAGSERLAGSAPAASSPETDTTQVNAAASRAGNAESATDTSLTDGPERTARLGPSIPAPDEEDEGARTGDTTSSEQSEMDRDCTVDSQDRGDESNTGAERMNSCPRCGATCLPDEIEQVFGYRTMRWTIAGGESTAVRRQSYCRQCRREHAAERRGHTRFDERFDEQSANTADPMPDNDGRRRLPPRYRAPTGKPPSPPESSQTRTTTSTEEDPPTRSQRTTVEVRILFQRDGSCTVSLLARRRPGFPEEITVSSESGEVDLIASQDEWYQDVVPRDLAELLRIGFIWTERETNQEWMLSAGREVFVLAPGTEHRGFVSCPRLTLGRDHVVLCAATRLPAVEDTLEEAGCCGWNQLGEDDGVPAGWRVLHNVRPRRPVLLDNDTDILNVLRPLPEIEIALEGGIRLSHNSWLLGYPPTIRVYGDPEHAETVLIDGQKAVGSDRVGYTTPEWDREGDHQIWCSSTNKSYSLVRGKENWTSWPAYPSSLRGARNDSCEFAFCGPLVCSTINDTQRDQRGPILVPPNNPVLLGAQPGQISSAYRRHDIHGAQCLGLPPFDPVWALPQQPLQCDKRSNRILLLGESEAVYENAEGRQSADSRDLERWCRMILDASRKGLAVEPASPAIHQLWRSYKQLARRLGKRLR